MEFENSREAVLEEITREAAETKAAIAAGEWPVFDTVEEAFEALGL